MAAEQSWDVIIVGAGNAALCAALSAAEQGVKVLVLEPSPPAASASAMTASKTCAPTFSTT
jgi:succinate dehydrogenase/fumarate reductase flavoprotein subunit